MTNVSAMNEEPIANENSEEVHKGSEDDDTWFRRMLRKILSYLKISELIEILQSFGYYAAHKVGEHVDKDVLIETILGVCSLTLLPQILRKYIGASNVFPNLLLTALLAVINNYRSKNKQKKPKEPEEPSN